MEPVTMASFYYLAVYCGSFYVGTGILDYMKRREEAIAVVNGLNNIKCELKDIKCLIQTTSNTTDL